MAMNASYADIVDIYVMWTQDINAMVEIPFLLVIVLEYCEVYNC